MAVGPLAVINEVAARLATCGVTLIGEDERNNPQTAPRFLWVPADDGFVRPTLNGADPPAFLECWSRWSVEILGDDYEKTWLLRQALLWVLRDETGNYFNARTGTWRKSDPTAKGYLCTQVVEFIVPLPVPDLPLVFGDPIVDTTSSKGRATTYTPDTTGEVDGDGVIALWKS